MCQITDKLTEIEMNLKYNVLLSLINVEFQHLDSDIDYKIVAALKHIGKFVNAQSCCIMKIYEDKEILRIPFRWTTNKNSILKELNKKDIGSFFWDEVVKTHKEHKNFKLNTTDLKSKSELLYNLLTASDVKSVIFFPLFRFDKYYGFISLAFSDHYISKEEIKLLTIFKKLFINAIEYRDRLIKKMDNEQLLLKKLERQQEFQNSILEAIPDQLFIIDRKKIINWTNRDKEKYIDKCICSLGIHKNEKTSCDSGICPLTKVFETGENEEFDSVSPDGRHYKHIITPCNKNGKIQTVLELKRDITEAVQAKDSKIIEKLFEVVRTGNVIKQDINDSIIKAKKLEARFKSIH